MCTEIATEGLVQHRIKGIPTFANAMDGQENALYTDPTDCALTSHCLLFSFLTF